MAIENFDIKGLTDAEVLASREKYGTNILESKKRNELLEAIKTLVKEPMDLIASICASLH